MASDTNCAWNSQSQAHFITSYLLHLPRYITTFALYGLLIHNGRFCEAFVQPSFLSRWEVLSILSIDILTRSV